MDNTQFEKYQQFTEKTIHDLSQKITVLENKLNMFTNLVEISKYINQYIKDPNLFTLINDMLIGVFGARYATIFIKLSGEYFEAVAQVSSKIDVEAEKELIMKHNEQEFIINSDTPIYPNLKEEDNIYSCMGVPILVDNHLLGFILIQHTEKDYFTKDHAVFLPSIANHIGVAIENNILYKQIRDSAYRDGLTELFNKRYFFETLENTANLQDMNYSIVMIDLDNFKQINDTYGHPMGDMVLKQIANIIKKNTRSYDIVARYGGDEIIIYLYNFVDKDKVTERVEAMRAEIEHTVIINEGVSVQATASFGVFIKKDKRMTLEEVIQKADEVLYTSKKGGKNRVSVVM